MGLAGRSFDRIVSGDNELRSRVGCHAIPLCSIGDAGHLELKGRHIREDVDGRAGSKGIGTGD